VQLLFGDSPVPVIYEMKQESKRGRAELNAPSLAAELELIWVEFEVTFEDDRIAHNYRRLLRF